jgi:hypothetical protein
VLPAVLSRCCPNYWVTFPLESMSPASITTRSTSISRLCAGIRRNARLAGISESQDAGCGRRSGRPPLWTAGLPNGFQELSSFPVNGRIPDPKDRPATSLELLHSMKVHKHLSPLTALLSWVRLSEVGAVCGKDGTTPSSTAAGSRGLGRCRPLRVGPAGCQRGVDARKTLSALAPDDSADCGRPSIREQPFIESQ